MAEAEVDRLERSVASLVSSVADLTKNVLQVSSDVSANREAISKLHEAIKLVSTDVEKHGLVLRTIEIEAAKEEGRKSAMGDLQAKLREHDEAAREVKAIRKLQVEQGEIISNLKQAHDQQRGVIIAISVFSPVVVTLLTAYVAKLLGVG